MNRSIRLHDIRETDHLESHIKTLRLITLLLVSSLSAIPVGADDASTVTGNEWLTQGGQISRMHQMRDWRAAAAVERLASSADLVAKQFRRLHKTLPERDFERLARLLEQKLSALTEQEVEDYDFVGEAVDRVWPMIK